MTTPARRDERTQLAAPRELSAEARRIFTAIVDQYGIVDAGGLEILRSGLICLDTATQAEARIAVDGQVVVDRFGQPRAHPLSSVARDARSQWLGALRLLNLEVGDPPPVGRPRTVE